MYLVSGNLDLKSQVMRKPALSVGGQEIEINVSFQKGCKNLSTSDLLSLYSPVCVGPGQKSRRQVFS